MIPVWLHAVTVALLLAAHGIMWRLYARSLRRERARFDAYRALMSGVTTAEKGRSYTLMTGDTLAFVGAKMQHYFCIHAEAPSQIKVIE